jgi:hypothetical protein
MYNEVSVLQNKCLKNCFHMLYIHTFPPTSSSSSTIMLTRVGVGIFNIALEVLEMDQVSGKCIITTKFS